MFFLPTHGFCHLIHVKESIRARIALPVKVLTWVAVTLQFNSDVLTCRAVCERNVVVGNIVEEMNFVSVEGQAGGNRVHWCITPSFVEETAILIERLKKVKVGLGPKPIETADLKV